MKHPVQHREAIPVRVGIVQGMAQMARDSGCGRESLCKALAPGAKPRYDTVPKVIRALGLRLHADIA